MSEDILRKSIEKDKKRGSSNKVQSQWGKNNPMIDEEGYLKPKEVRIFLKECRGNERDYLLFNLLARAGRRIAKYWG